MGGDAGEGPFRTPARARPPAIVALAERGPGRLAAAPRRSARERRRRLIAACRARRPAGRGRASLVIGVMAVAVALMMCRGPVLRWTGMASFGALILASLVYQHWADRRSVAAVLARGETRRFPVRGFATWIESERPVLRVAFRAPVDPPVLAAAVRAHDPHIAIYAHDDRSIALGLPPMTARLPPASKYDEGAPIPCGDPAAFDRLAAAVLDPLHAELGIIEVVMGGPELLEG